MTASDNEVVIDVCGLEPPEPLERVLDALSRLEQGHRLRVVIGREPFPLYRILENNGYAYQTHSREDYLYDILIWEKDKS